MKPPEEIISIEKKPEIQKPLFSAGKVIKAAVDICLRLPFKQRVVRVVKKIVKKIVKTILPASSVQVIKKAVKR